MNFVALLRAINLEDNEHGRRKNLLRRWSRNKPNMTYIDTDQIRRRVTLPTTISSLSACTTIVEVSMAHLRWLRHRF